MQSPTNAYGKVAKQIAGPRELEASLLLDAALRLQTVQKAWGSQTGGLDTALHYNRRLWTFFLTSVSDNENPLPVDVRQNVANLGLFVCNHTMEILADPRPESLGSLININRQLAAGLLGQAA
jgi:flagellar biosynthesis activator protein FlaF